MVLVRCHAERVVVLLDEVVVADHVRSFKCGFRRSGPPIPNEGGHRFRLMAARDSDDPGHCSPLLAL
jgi:hypothetical protein